MKMSCKRGKANPDPITRLRLFADSGGYCQNPQCNTNLFLSVGEFNFHIAEMAHIISVGDSGPRKNKTISKEAKGNYSNLILLCPTCHTKIDKAELEFPEISILDWKASHGKRIRDVFNIRQFGNRKEARLAVVPIMNQNKTIFNIYGPMTDERFNPESETPRVWLSKVHEFILPNNRRLLSIFDDNYSLLNDEEIKIVELYRQHVFDFEKRHINNEEIDAVQFPEKLENVYND